MQLFPTAFWKHGFTNIPDGEDSCYECINTTVLNADDNSYRLKIATTPDAEGDDGVGLYKDYIFSEIVVSQEGLPFAHLNRADGKKTDLGVYEPDINAELPEGDFPECWKEGEKPYEFVSQEGIDNPDGTCCNGWLEWLCQHVKYYGEKAEDVYHRRKANQKGVVYATKPPIGLHGEGLWKGWQEFWTQHLNNTSGVPTESSILDHWLYIWTEKSTFRYSGVDYDLHKTSPVTITPSADCKKVTVTCYFEKDVLQKLYELQEGPASAKGGSTTALAENYQYDKAGNSELNLFAYWGFNGLREELSDMVNFYYRQKAKARLKFKLGSAKDLKIKIKGLGTDFHNQFPEASQRNIGHSATFVSRKYSFFDEDPEDQKKAGLYAITPDLIKQDLEGLNINANEPNLYAQPGDVQSCTIFFDNEEKIKCVAPVLNYYEGSAVLDLIYEYYPYQLKGPVRIFELESIENNEDDGGIIKNYKGVGSSSHPVEGLGYIEESEYPDEYGYSRWLESPTIINPYGKQWTEGEDYFYDGGSNMITPDYYSPYEYEHTLNNVSAGEHTIDIVFDSVAEMFNGGAYYEIEISHT